MKIEESGSRPTSTPPEAKVVEARGAAVVAAIGALTDVVGACLIGALIYSGRMEPDPWGWVLAGLAGGTIIGKARGGRGGTTAGLLIGTGAGAAAATGAKAGKVAMAKKVVAGLWLSSIFLLGCGSSLPMPRSATEARVTLMRAERTLDDVQLFAGPACSMLHSHPDFADHCRVYRELMPRAGVMLLRVQRVVGDAAAVETLSEATLSDVRELLSLVGDLQDRYLP